jgi:hypothetical protein
MDVRTKRVNQYFINLLYIKLISLWGSWSEGNNKVVEICMNSTSFTINEVVSVDKQMSIFPNYMTLF